MLDTIESLVVVLDRSGEIQIFNRACENLTEYSFEEARGRCVWDFLLLPGEAKSVRDVFRQLSMGHFPNSHENCWVTRSASSTV